MLRLWNRKDSAVMKWRSRAWTIDPKVTNLIIIKPEASNPTNMDIEVLNLNIPQLLEAYPQYFDAIADMEQFGW